MTKIKEKKVKTTNNKNNYEKINLDSKEILNGIISFLKVLDENEVGIDEITIHLTSEKTGKSKKINLFKDFIKFAKNLTKTKDNKSNSRRK